MSDNNPTLEQCVKLLKEKHQFSSDGDSYALNKLIDFYEQAYALSRVRAEKTQEKTQEKPMRYFLVAYFVVTGKGGGNGLLAFSAEEYPSGKELTEQANENALGKTVITNIIELSKEDFESFNKPS